MHENHFANTKSSLSTHKNIDVGNKPVCTYRQAMTHWQIEMGLSRWFLSTLLYVSRAVSHTKFLRVGPLGLPRTPCFILRLRDYILGLCVVFWAHFSTVLGPSVYVRVFKPFLNYKRFSDLGFFGWKISWKKYYLIFIFKLLFFK